MKKNTKGDLTYYTFEHFEATGLVRHGFSTRFGGVSDGYWSSLNLGFSRGDKRENVVRNYEIFCGALGIDTKNLVFSWQTHTTNVKAIKKSDCGNGFMRENALKDIDGLATNESETAIVTFYADCVPIYFLDPVKKSIAISHAGWRGTLNRIAYNTVKLMESEYGSDAGDILAGIAPSIGQCCFEVDEPVYSMFEQADYAKEFVKETAPDKRNIDLWGVNRKALTDSGIKPENIEVAGICTKCNGDIFYSHRNMGDNRGSLAAVMELI